MTFHTKRTMPGGCGRFAGGLLLLSVFFCLGILAGCGASRPVKYYVLDPGPTPAAGSSPAAKYPVTLLVARVTSSHLYHDDRLVFGSGPVQLGTYEYERWAEPPTEMLQDALVSSLRSSGQYQSVSGMRSNLRGGYILRGHLNALDEVDKPEVAARFSLDLELVDAKTGASLWTDSYSHDSPVKGKGVADVVEALDQSVREGLAQMVAKVGEYFASHPPQAAGGR
jgi:cholesterol transport system auxiliary component